MTHRSPAPLPVPLSLRIIAKTDKAALCVSMDERELEVGRAWLPYSRVDGLQDYEVGDIDVVDVPAWLVDANGIQPPVRS